MQEASGADTALISKSDVGRKVHIVRVDEIASMPQASPSKQHKIPRT